LRIEFLEMAKLTNTQTDALSRLRAAVYPPKVLATSPARFFTWATVQWSVFLWDSDELVARVGLVVRDVLDNGVTKRIGGIGGVATHPARQGQGLASIAMREAEKHFREELNVLYALLFCRPHLVEFYKRLDWKPFQGQVFVEQPQGKVEFSANGAMVLDVREQAPTQGVLDLNGLPW
jgi:ribosomal protein S18 acetylase RimI-like enzyme